MSVQPADYPSPQSSRHVVSLPGNSAQHHNVSLGRADVCVCMHWLPVCGPHGRLSAPPPPPLTLAVLTAATAARIGGAGNGHFVVGRDVTIPRDIAESVRATPLIRRVFIRSHLYDIEVASTVNRYDVIQSSRDRERK